jgi:hypothetical protein
MLNVISGLLSGAGAPASTTSYESIATYTATGSVSTVSFASIPSTYKHLQIRCAVLTTAGGINIQYNSDTGSNYTYHQLYGTGAGSGAANAGTAQTAGFIGYNNAAGSNPTAIVCDVLDYQNTNKYKTHRSLAGTDVNGSGGTLTFFSGLWLNTAAISSIDIKGTFAQYSSFALYGIKG